MTTPLESLTTWLGEPGSLRRQTLTGGNWMMLRSAVIAAVDFIRAAVFARVLFPHDYGLVALATMVIGFLDSFSATGIEFIILRESDDHNSRLPVYWTILMIRGFCLTLLGCVLAYPLARFYDRPELIPVVCALSLTMALRGLGGFGRELRQRTMAFRPVAVVDMISVVSELALSLVFLFILRSFWAIVAYAILHSVAMFIGSYVMHPWRPSIRFDRSVLRAVVLFSSSVIGINLCNYFFTSFDVGVIGRLLDMDQLGLYARASFLALLPVTYLANVLAPVLLPALFKTVDDPRRMRDTFRKMVLVHMVFYGVVGTAILLFSRPIVLIVYGERWLGALDAFRILVVYGISKSIASIASMMLFAMERPWIITVSSVLMAGSFAVICIPFTRTWGIEGTAWAVVLSGIISHLFSLVATSFFLRSRCMQSNGLV